MSLPNNYLKKGYHWTVDETFKAHDNDTRIAVLLEDDNYEIVDWNFFSTLQEAKQFIREDYASQGVKCPEVL